MRPAVPPLTSTEVCGRLYTLGIVVTRDWLARLSDALFGPEVRRVRGGRRFTEEQAEILQAAALLRRHLGVTLEQLSDLAGGRRSVITELRSLLSDLDDGVATLTRLCACKAAS